MSELAGKRLLILGGAHQHCKLVHAAHSLGVLAYVTDYLKDSPAKRIADDCFQIDITDYDALVKLCQEKRVDGVIAGWLDPCQIPYLTLCERLGLPCYGSKEQFETLTNKMRFKRYCRKHNVDTILSYPCDSPRSEMQFPLFVKPTNSRGSRGQNLCFDESSLDRAIKIAQSESTDGEAIIEQYMKGARDISVTYFFINGKAYIERLSDRFLGSKEAGLERVAIGTSSPSACTQLYLKNVNDRVISMLKDLGIENGPVFMQGFLDGDTVRFYDPGLRFPGGEYEQAFCAAWGIDFSKLLIEYALTGSITDRYGILSDSMFMFADGYEVIHDVSVRSGAIKEISGVEEIKALPGVVSVVQRYNEKQRVQETHDVGHRFLEVNFLADTVEQARRISHRINSLISVKDDAGMEMVVSPLNPELIGL